MLTPAARPVLWRLARVDFDTVRRRSVLLYPEGAMFLNDTAVEILELCDGQRTIIEIGGILSAKYGSDVATDVREYLSQLADRELVVDAV
jgi:pyrroloquinoline quinone biosynthesis protein D